MPYTKFTYDRFHIHSYNATKPNERAIPGGNAPRYLVFLSHGYYEKESTETTVRGVQRVSFACNHERTADPDDVEKWIRALPRQNAFFFDRTNAGDTVINYTLRKELDLATSKREFKGKAEYDFVDKSYIQSVYPEDATFDIAGIHNTLTSGRTVKLSDLFEMLNSKLPNLYTDLLCGFCREFNAKA